MFGFNDFWIGLVFFLCLASTVVCGLYGIVNWNRGSNEVPNPKFWQWRKEEDKLEEEI